MSAQDSITKNQCSSKIEKTTEVDLSEDAVSYACGIIEKAEAEPENLSERSLNMVANQAKKWDDGYFGFVDVQNKDEV